MEASGFVMMNMSTDLSGVYTCKVSTNTQERISRKRIKIYKPADSITMDVLERAVSGEVAVSCSVSGCLPQPVLTLYTVPGSIVLNCKLKTNIKPQVDRYTLQNGKNLILLA